MNAKCWKRMGLIGSIVLTLSASSMNVRAHGGGCGPCFWPFLPLAFGLGAAFAAAASSPSYSSPAYGYAPPVYRYSAPTPSSSAAEAPQAVAAAESPIWIPSTPGVGHWVPDPNPYNAQTTAAATAQKPKPAKAPQVTTFTHSAGNVPVIVVSR